MQSWLRRKASSSGGVSPLLGKDKKKELQELAGLTPLERLLHDTGKNEQPVAEDGNDKVFGFENFGNTCYANSILQSLYFSVPFREEVLNYPQRAPLDSVLNGPDGLPRPTVKITPQAPAAQNKQKNPASPATARIATKPEDKGSSDYKKKQALIKGPVIPMDYDNSQTYGMNESLFTSLKDIFEGILANKARMGVIRPSKLVETLRKERMEFNTGQHQDAHEFLNLLLNSVIDTVEEDAANKRKANVSKASSRMNGQQERQLTLPATASIPGSGWVHDLFQGTLTSETVCLTCEKLSQRDEPFIDLSVDIEQFSSVTACLRHFSEEEMLSERNKFSCDNCGYTESQKRMKIKRLPKILALHLKRFKAVETAGGWGLQKSHHRVVYPFHLRLFNTTDDVEDPDKLYELYAVVVHIGAGPYQGHYISVIKTSEFGWVLFDDELVEPVRKEFVQNFFGDRPGQASAYVLFYQETTEERVQAEQAREGMRNATPRTPALSSLKSPVPKTPTSAGIGLGLSSPLSNGTQGVPIPENPIDEAAHTEEQLARAKIVVPSATPKTPSTSFPPTPNLEHAKTSDTDALQNGNIPASTPAARTSFLGRMRRPSKSGKRSNFLGALDLTKESKMKDPMSNSVTDASNGIPDTSGEETPRAVVNGHAQTEPFPPTPEIPQDNEEKPAQAQQASNGSIGKTRFLSLRRRTGDKKNTEKANGLRKSASKGNILGLGRS